jgi:MoaA/NifB/PqqE/SkfB family radical SAM enzyme
MLSDKIIHTTLAGLLSYLKKDPLNRMPKLLDWTETLDIRKKNGMMINKIRDIVSDPVNPWNNFILSFLNDLSPQTVKKIVSNLLVRSAVQTNHMRVSLREKYNMNIPWALIMDPTSACNLNCKGCWSAEYSKTTSLETSLMDRIITEGKKIGIYIYLYTGGEPLVRKKDLLYLARKHNDCYFISFTNGTLIDEDFAKELAQLGNFAPSISIEGYEKDNDMRRGEGTFHKAIEAMELLKKYGVFFGFSTCYHRKNTEVICSEEYIDLMLEKGNRFGWYFTYFPVGKHALPELLASPEQREYMYHEIRRLRRKKALFLMDFWNDAEFVGGCIAGGRRYLHINSNGDVEPCVFIHYSNMNIKDHSLFETLQSPIFKEYRKHQPFNHNHLRPCPCLDNPAKIRNIVNSSQAVPTQVLDHETIEELTAKCERIAYEWTQTANKLWEQKQDNTVSKVC